MNTKNMLAAIIVLLLPFYFSNAQIKVKTTGKVVMGEERPTDDAENKLTLQLLGPGGEYRSDARLAFGDYGSYAYYGVNVVLGEYGGYDSDQLWLHGKNGIYMTWNRGENLIGYYDPANGDKFMFNCPVYSSGNYLTSDERFKEGIQHLDSALTHLTRLNGVSYYYNFPSGYNNTKKNTLQQTQDMSTSSTGVATAKEEKERAYYSALEAKNNNPKDRKLGFLAQDLQKVFPELVAQDSAGYYYVDYTGLIPVIIEALKEQQKTIEAQNTKISELERRIGMGDNKGGSKK